MSESGQGAYTKQVFGEGLVSLEESSSARSMPAGVNAELLRDAGKSTDENSTEGLNGTCFTPHPPEKRKDSEQHSQKRVRRKQFRRRLNRVESNSQSSEEEKLVDRKGFLDNRTTGSRLPPLSNDLNSDVENKINTETNSSTNVIADKNVKPLTFKLKPLSPINDSQKVADNFKTKQSLERTKHETKEKGPVKPLNPIERISGLNEQTHLDKVHNNLDSSKPMNKQSLNNGESDDKSENTLTSVSSNDSDSDNDSQSSPGYNPIIPKTYLFPTAPNTPPAHARHHHRSSLSLNSVKDYPEQVNRHSDTEAIKRRGNNRKSSKDLWSKAKVVTLLPRVPAAKARDRNSNFVKEELEKYLPERKLMVFVGTWNMHGEKVG